MIYVYAFLKCKFYYEINAIRCDKSENMMLTYAHHILGSIGTIGSTIGGSFGLPVSVRNIIFNLP